MALNTTSIIVNPNVNLDIPNWINEEYFVPILEKDVPQFDKICSFKCIAATQAGENYTSIMVRVIMDILLKGKIYINITIFL